MSRNWSEQSEPKKQNAYGSCDWRKKQQTERKIHPAMVAMKRIMPSRNDVLIRGPEGDPRWQPTNSQASKGSKVRFWHLADIDLNAEHVCFRRQSEHPPA